jgi:hypothetical protein
MIAKQYRDAIQALGCRRPELRSFSRSMIRPAELDARRIQNSVVMLLRLTIRLRLEPKQATEKEFDRDHKTTSAGLD